LDTRSFFAAVLLCFGVIVLFGLFFSGIIGGLIGGLLGGLIVRGVSRGVVVGFFGGIFGSLTLALIELFGFVFWDEAIVGRLLWGSSSVDLVGLVIILAFIGILTAVAGGFIGGFLSLLRKG